MVKSNGHVYLFAPLIFWVEIKVRTTPGLERQNLPCEQNKIRDKNASYGSLKPKPKKNGTTIGFIVWYQVKQEKNAMLSRLRKIYIAPTIKIQRREVLVKLKLSRPRADKLPVGFWPKTSWAFINWRCHVVGERSITCNSQGVAESHEIAKVIRRSKERFLHSVKRVFLYLTGADPGFFLGGGALVSFSTSTPINHKVFFFFCRIPVVLENRRSSQEGEGAHPLHPRPRSAPANS